MAGEFGPGTKGAIWDRDGGCCCLCARYLLGVVEGWSYQHRRARGMGGSKLTDTGAMTNGLMLCGDGVRGCHGYVESHPSWAAAMGYRVPQGVDPATVPVWTARNGWVFLTTDGRYEPTTDPHPEETRVLDLVSDVLHGLDDAS